MSSNSSLKNGLTVCGMCTPYPRGMDIATGISGGPGCLEENKLTLPGDTAVSISSLCLGSNW